MQRLRLQQLERGVRSVQHLLRIKAICVRLCALHCPLACQLPALCFCCTARQSLLEAHTLPGYLICPACPARANSKSKPARRQADIPTWGEHGGQCDQGGEAQASHATPGTMKASHRVYLRCRRRQVSRTQQMRGLCIAAQAMAEFPSLQVHSRQEAQRPGDSMRLGSVHDLSEIHCD